MRYPIFINSDENVGTASDFTVTVNPPIDLSKSLDRKMCLVSNSMSYSWYNISAELSNNTFKYSHDSGTTWATVTIKDGHYDYENLNAFIQAAVLANSHSATGITLMFKNQYYRVKIALEATYRMDVRPGNFSTIIGFDKVAIAASSLGTKLNNITYGFDNLCLHTDVIDGSIRSGIERKVIHSESLSAGHKTPTFPFSYSPLTKL